jgi:hypothetical protein
MHWAAWGELVLTGLIVILVLAILVYAMAGAR